MRYRTGAARGNTSRRPKLSQPHAVAAGVHGIVVRRCCCCCWTDGCARVQAHWDRATRTPCAAGCAGCSLDSASRWRFLPACSGSGCAASAWTRACRAASRRATGRRCATCACCATSTRLSWARRTELAGTVAHWRWRSCCCCGLAGRWWRFALDRRTAATTCRSIQVRSTPISLSAFCIMRARGIAQRLVVERITDRRLDQADVGAAIEARALETVGVHRLFRAAARKSHRSAGSRRRRRAWWFRAGRRCAATARSGRPRPACSARLRAWASRRSQ